MKKIAVFLSLSCLVATNLFPLDPPKPVKNTPNIISSSGKSFFRAGGTVLQVSCPEGWGVGDLFASQDYSHFSLFPNQGGFGCTVTVNRFANEGEAQEEALRLKSTFSNALDLSNGFEATFKSAWYACQVEGLFVVQMWYSLPKKNPEHEALWQKMKQCLAVSSAQAPVVSPSTEWKPAIEAPWKGWVCNHPSNKLHVLLKCTPVEKVAYNLDLSKAYLFAIGDLRASGFFYIKWDQVELDKVAPYEQHLKEMAADILKMEKTQTFAKDLTSDLQGGWSLRNGNPYTLITFSGDGFLFGFALKQKNQFVSYDFNDYIKRVEWWVDN